eukprot:jgi/Mesvir1/15290/Mv06502-RA.1
MDGPGYKFDWDENEGAPKEDAQGKLVYLEKCEAMNLVPVSQILKQLEMAEMQVTHYGLGNRGAIPLAEALKVNNVCSAIRLGDNLLSDEGAICIAHAVETSHSITELDLSDNKVGGKGVAMLAKLLVPGASALHTLSLKGNKLLDRDVLPLLEALLTNTAMFVLDLSCNQLAERTGIALADALCVNTTLVDVNLGWNNLGPKGGAAMAKALTENRQLQCLNLGWNGIGDTAGAQFASAIKGENQSLVELNLSSNRLSACGPALAEALRENESLASLVLDWNAIGDDAAAIIQKSMEVNKGIVAISLANTAVSQPLQDAIAAVLEKRRAEQEAAQLMDLLNP